MQTTDSLNLQLHAEVVLDASIQLEGVGNQCLFGGWEQVMAPFKSCLFSDWERSCVTNGQTERLSQ